ncbi:hypothetical protein Vadar_012144 [Vaccinium darrowii]|uniref:Uncharacterized protein n=1 Tax=Vaccinium darrowii TaxID=229202 RepID=A0ACB7XQ26_9ERIC|nr:hypothetical protein Vadar_012144 [Vaccinium darrowii]
MTNRGAKFVLVVEKETIYLKVAEQRFFEDVLCILLAKKGQLDMASRQFLWRLRYELKLPVLCLVDCDPYDISIMTTYKYRTKIMADDDCKMEIMDMKWLVICLADLEKFEILEDVTLPMIEDALGQVKTCRRNHS